MECRRCQSPLPPAALFCPRCGLALAEDPLDSPTELTPPDPGRARTPSGAPSPGEGGVTSGRPEAPERSSRPGGRGLGRIASDTDPDARFGFGEILGQRYRILGKIGGGGMGEVYRADDLKLGQPVALKFLPEALASDPDRLSRLFAEVRLARQVSHRNVCRVYDVVEHGADSFLSMEFIDGEDLGSLLKRVGKFSEDKATELARQICAGLQAAHEKGILHRDLKPANILVDSEGVAHIADFGLAGLGEEIGAHEIRAGTPSYMAPEQVEGRQVTAQSDIYALGLLLFEMYTGRRALTGRSLREIESKRSELFTHTSTELAGLDPAIERAIARCLDPDPAQRPASALAVAAALPGGDPLAAALAAGEVPSPEMIAASGSAGTLPLPIAVAALALVVLGIAVQVWLAPRTRVEGIVGLPKSSSVLADRAAELRRGFGYPDSLVRDEAHGWWFDPDVTAYEERVRPEAPAWDSLATGRPSPIGFWFRESPMHLAARNLVGQISPGDPPRTEPGMVLVVLDPRGRLEWFHGVPGGRPSRPTTADSLGQTEAGLVDASVAPVRGLDLDAAFAAAGFERGDFEPVARNWTPSHYADEIHTFRGRYPERPGFPIELRIAGYEGRLAWFEVVEPWELAETGAATSGDRGELGQRILQGLVILLMLSTALLARRNFRLGQGDRRGAARLATFAIVTMSGSLLLSAHHVPLFQTEWNIINVTIGIGLVLGGISWLIYIALEPFARRVWPETLISWTRLLQGRVRDPRVGRDLLLGLAAGSLLGAAAPLKSAFIGQLGQPPAAPISFAASLAGGLFDYVATLLNIPLNAAWISMAILLLAIGIRVLVRKKALAIIVSSLFFFIVLSLGEKGPAGVLLTAIGVALFVGTLFRLGLLAMMVLYMTTELHRQIPFTSDFGAWYAWTSVVAIFLMLGLALHGYRLSRAAGR